MLEAILGLLVAMAALGARFTGFDRDTDVELWQYVTYTGAGFLAIGLVRDVLILIRRGGARQPKRAGEKLICFESLAGSLLVVAGLALLLASVERQWHPSLSSLGIYAGAIFVASGGTKDVVLVFKREKDHMNLIPW